MDMMLSSESAWAEVSGSEDLKITEAAEAFLTLLFTMTERYSILSQPGHRCVYGDVKALQGWYTSPETHSYHNTEHCLYVVW